MLWNNKMKSILPVISLTIGLFLSLCSCTGPIATVKATCESFQSQHHHTDTVRIDSGGTITVILCSNQSTGFQWNDKANIVDTSIVKQQSHEYKLPDAEQPGTAGTEIWKFKAENPGRTAITFEYSQPWTGGIKNEWTYHLTVNVN